MQKSISVFSVSTPNKSIHYPSKATASKALEILQSFGVESKLIVEKKIFNLTEVEEKKFE